jgi:hypothetical protein
MRRRHAVRDRQLGQDVHQAVLVGVVNVVGAAVRFDGVEEPQFVPRFVREHPGRGESTRYPRGTGALGSAK